MDDIKVNDCVKIDGSLRGRVVSIIKPLGTYNVYNVKLEDGTQKQVPRYKLQRVAETVSSSINMSFDAEINGVNIDELLDDDFLDFVNGDIPKYCDDSEIAEFIGKNQNANTLRKNDLKILTKFMAAENDERKIETLSADELSRLLCKFIINVKKADGSNYEPSSVRGIISSVDRHLKSTFYGKSILNDPEFSNVRDVLKTKQKILKQSGMGNLPNRAQSLDENDISQLWNVGELGFDNPESWLNTLWWQNTIHFGLRSVTPHRNMAWGDVTLNTDSNGIEFLEFTERQTKTRTGVNIRDVRTVTPKAYATGDDRCPVMAYRCYASLRPAGFNTPESPFYLATNSKTKPVLGHPWFKRQPVGVNKLSGIMRRMANNANLGSKRLTNHSARKYMIQTLSEHDIPPTQIMQISGHKNIQSVNNYSHISENQHKSISRLITRPTSVSSQVALPLADRSTPSNVALPSSSAPANLSLPPPQAHNVNMTSCNSRSLSSIFAGPINNSVIHVNVINQSSSNVDTVPPTFQK